MTLKAVLIIGPDFPGSSKDLDILKKLYAREGYLIIGDGEGNISIDKIKELKGQIGSNTRIDLYAHGHSNSEGFLELELNDDCWDANDLFKLLSQVNDNNPLYIHLWSCHSGLANKSFSSLPDRSVLITHAPEEFEALSNFNAEALPQSIKNFQQSDILLPEASQIKVIKDFLNNLPYESLSHSSVTISLGQEVFHIKIEIEVENLFQDSSSTINNVARDVIEEFQKFCKKASLQVPDLSIPNFTASEIETLQVGCLMYYFMTQSNQEKILSLLKDLSAEFLNKKIGQEGFLQVAVYTSKDQVVEFLLGKKDLTIEDNSNIAPLLYLAVQGSGVSVASSKYNIVKLLLQKGFNSNSLTKDHASPLHLAAAEGYTETVELLLEVGAKIDIPDVEGNMPIHYAATMGHTSVVKLLINEGADINSVNQDQQTPLCRAATRGHIETVKLLIDLGADLNKSDGYNKPFQAAIFNKHIETFKLLMPYAQASELELLINALEPLGYSPEECESITKLIRNEIGEREIYDTIDNLAEKHVVGEDSAREEGAIEV